MRQIIKNVAVTTVMMFAALALAAPVHADQSSLVDKVTNALTAKYHGTLNPESGPGAEAYYVSVSSPAEGEILLEGTAKGLYEKYRIFDIVSKVDGVKEIKTDIAVQTDPVPQDIIERRIRQEVNYNNSIVEKDRIKIEAAQDGLVILSGTVSFNYEKKLVQTIASWQEGVRSIRNDIKILPPKKRFSDSNLQKYLNEILENQFPTDKDNVTVNVEYGVATVKGKVDDLWSKRNIEEEFRDVIGIVDVNSKLKVAS